MLNMVKMSVDVVHEVHSDWRVTPFRSEPSEI